TYHNQQCTTAVPKSQSRVNTDKKTAGFAVFFVMLASGGSVMPRTETRYERLDDIERLLARRPEGWTTSELARELDVAPDTILRDLTLLEARGTGLIKQGRRYLLDHRRSLHTIRIS